MRRGLLALKCIHASKQFNGWRHANRQLKKRGRFWLPASPARCHLSNTTKTPRAPKPYTRQNPNDASFPPCGFLFAFLNFALDSVPSNASKQTSLTFSSPCCRRPTRYSAYAQPFSLQASHKAQHLSLSTSTPPFPSSFACLGHHNRSCRRDRRSCRRLHASPRTPHRHSHHHHALRQRQPGAHP